MFNSRALNRQLKAVWTNKNKSLAFQSSNGRNILSYNDRTDTKRNWTSRSVEPDHAESIGTLKSFRSTQVEINHRDMKVPNKKTQPKVYQRYLRYLEALQKIHGKGKLPDYWSNVSKYSKVDVLPGGLPSLGKRH
jgi:hypothetical protein